MPNRTQVKVQNVQSMDDLRTVFHLPINDAAKKLGLCVTVLKQKCREFGIVRWPFRKVKKIDMLIKQLEEEKEKIVSSSSVSGKEEELPRGLKEQQGEERGGNFVVVGAPTRKVILEDIENRLQEMLKMRDELYADPNSNIHLLPNSSGSAINSGGGGLTAEKRGESNNTRSPSRQQAKAAKAAAAANAVQKHQQQLQEKSTEKDDDKDDDDTGAEKKKSTAATNTEMKIAESTHTSQESDERRADVVQIDDEFSLSAPTEEEKKKKGKSFSTGRLWQRKERVIEKATAATPTRPTLKRQGSNSSGKDSGLLFDALLDAATALDTTKKNGGKGEQVSGDENNNVINNSDDYEWGRNTEKEAGQDESIIGSPRKVRRSCDVQRSVRPPSSDISREKKGLEPRPNSAPLNMNNISEADVAAAFYQQMQLQHVQNTAAAVAAMQAAMATSMNPSQQSIPLMYQVPYSLQYMNLNSNMMQVQWAEMNKNINATAAIATNSAGMSLLERRAAEAAASIGGGNVAMPPSSLDLKIPTGSGEGSTHSGTCVPYYGGGMYSPRQYHHYQQQQMISMPVLDQSAASDGNSSLETGGVYTAEDKNIRGSGVATPTSIGAFPSSNRVSFEDMTGHPSPISPTNTTAGIHRPVALKRGHLELQSNQFI